MPKRKMILKTPRYGFTLRRVWSEVVSKARAKYECPRCKKVAVRRVSAGIWKCRRCGLVMAGGAYELLTQMGKKVVALYPPKDRMIEYPR